MGKINLLRIDDRLIHGQVMTKWSKGLGTNAIYVVDNDTAADEFMKDIYIQTNSSAGLKIRVYSADEVVNEWNKDQFGDDNAILIFKTVKAVKEVIDKGLPAKSLNIGGIAKKANSKFVIPSVGLTKEDGALLKELSDKNNVDIYFQTVPETRKVSLEDALKSL